MLNPTSLMNREADSRHANAVRAFHANVLRQLSGWFLADFHLLDGASGEPVTGAFQLPPAGWDARSELCRAVATRGKPEIVEAIGPVVMLAIPFDGDDQRSVVAVAAFVTAHAATPAELESAAEILGFAAEDVGRWMVDQEIWTTDVLLRMGKLAAERLATQWRLESLDREVRDLSLNLSTTYEEISLIYRLTQNLKLTSKDEELAALALEWLAEVLPAQALAIRLTPTAHGGSMGSQEPREPLFLSYGDCPIDGDDLRAILDRFELKPGRRPLIVNQPADDEDWPWPNVRELIVISLCEGRNCFGWLVAVNRLAGGEFGTVEASLLSTVAAILGIHSGNAQLYQQQREFFAGVVRALTSAIDAKDPYTCGHSDRVARVAVRLAEELGCNQKQIDTVYLSGLLHDVGKIGIDDNVLRKPGKLTEAEFEHIKSHTEIGHKILSDIKQLDEVLPVVLHHHEQWDGLGYPSRLAGEAIPYLARIVSVADGFDAMGSDRPYRQGLVDEKIDAILHNGAGQQWDAAVVAAFFRAREDIRAISQQKVKNLSLDVREWT